MASAEPEFFVEVVGTDPPRYRVFCGIPKEALFIATFHAKSLAEEYVKIKNRKMKKNELDADLQRGEDRPK